MLTGVILVSLSVLLPTLMMVSTEHRSLTANFQARYLGELTPFITIASMASSFVAAAVILSFEKASANRESILFGVLTISIFVTEIMLSIYVSVVRQSLVVSTVYLLMGLVPFGLACTMFTLATIVGRVA